MNDISWKRMRFKGNKVWLATDKNNQPILKNEKVLIKYQIEQEHEYWVYESSVQPLDSVKNSEYTKEKKKKTNPGRKNKATDQSEHIQSEPDRDILVYTDGASSGNPGHSGIGVFFKYKSHEKELSKYIGIATNNIAELEAIKAGLLELKNTDKPVRIFTDSSYAYGLLVLGWKAKKNIPLVQEIKKIILNFKDLKFIKVKGHAGDEGNERADVLATSAIKNASSQIKD
jgi:ribonuclease HI